MLERLRSIISKTSGDAIKEIKDPSRRKFLKLSTEEIGKAFAIIYLYDLTILDPEKVKREDVDRMIKEAIHADKLNKSRIEFMSNGFYVANSIGAKTAFRSFKAQNDEELFDVILPYHEASKYLLDLFKFNKLARSNLAETRKKYKDFTIYFTESEPSQVAEKDGGAILYINVRDGLQTMERFLENLIKYETVTYTGRSSKQDIPKAK